MKDIFNRQADRLHQRPAPQAPHDLAERIIAASHRIPDASQTFVAFILLPRPVVVLTLVLMLSIFIGMEVDLGFNSAEALQLNEQALLLSLEEDGLL